MGGKQDHFGQEERHELILAISLLLAGCAAPTAADMAQTGAALQGMSRGMQQYAPPQAVPTKCVTRPQGMNWVTVCQPAY